MHSRIYSFPPVISDQSKILILGSVPGIKSLEMQQYYAHPQNKFWPILFEIFAENLSEDYDVKIKFLQKHNIAVWDVIDSCERKSSLDSDIRNEEANEISKLIIQHPNIQAIYCNGQKSFKNLQKILGKEFSVPFYLLPSTSPAYAAMPYTEKLKAWKKITEFL